VSLVNHPTHIAMTVDCPCGGTHVYRTGRRWEDTHRAAPAQEAKVLARA
jgi:hypothetical protein